MKSTIQTDTTGCISNLFRFVTGNARWIAEAQTGRSASTRMRVVRTHLLNSLDNAQAWHVIQQLESAVTLTEQGIEL